MKRDVVTPCSTYKVSKLNIVP